MQPICTIKQLQIFGLTIAGISLVSILITLFVFNYPSFANQRVIEALLFKNNTESMKRFETTADLKNLQLSFYVYNITNPDEVRNGSNVHLKELGPFVYSEYKTKTFVNNNQTSGLISYNLTRRFVFNQEASWGQKDPKSLNITWFNIPLLGITNSINELPFDIYKYTAYKYLNPIIKMIGEDAFIVDSVHNLLIGGSPRPIFKYIRKHLPLIKVPLLNDTFGLLYGKNETKSGHILTTSAGFGPAQTYHDLNQYVAIDNKKRLNVWKDMPGGCNKVGGTDGEFFSPFGDRNKNLEIFPLDLCRKLSLKYKANATLMGIHTWKYVLDPKTLESSTKNLDNACYCLAKNSSAPECNMDGLIDLQYCNNQKNVFASGAHFWAGSDNLTLGFTGDGGTRDPAKHEPSFLVEPITGLALKVMVPIQFNLKLTAFKEEGAIKNNFDVFKFLDNEKPIYLPFAWVDESSEMTEEQSKKLKRELLIFDTWLISMVLGGSIILIVAIIVAAVILCLKWRNPAMRVPRETDPLVRSRPRSYV